MRGTSPRLSRSRSDIWSINSFWGRIRKTCVAVDQSCVAEGRLKSFEDVYVWRNNTPQLDQSWENKLEWTGWCKINQNKAEGVEFSSINKQMDQ